MLAAIRGIGRTLDFALEEAKETDRPLYLLFVREQPVVTREDKRRKWMDDDEAFKIFEYAAEHADGHTVLPCYAVSESPADTIVDIAATVGASRLILGAPTAQRAAEYAARQYHPAGVRHAAGGYPPAGVRVAVDWSDWSEDWSDG